MLKVMLVDDQKMELDGIERLLNWDKLGMCIVGKAVNGREGIRLAEQLAPDIVITDIVMPDMDGLAMMETLRTISEPVRIVCISCFDDFKFVSMAMNRGASGFVLKPILAKELEDVMLRVGEEIQNQRKNSRLLKLYSYLEDSPRVLEAAVAARMLQLPFSAGDTGRILRHFGWPDGFYAVCADIGSEERQQLLTEENKQLPVLIASGESSYILLPAPEEETSDWRGGLQEMFDALSGTLQRRVYFGVSHRHPAAKLPQAAKEAVEALDYACQNTGGAAFYPARPSHDTGDGKNLALLKTELKELLIRRERAAADGFLRKWIPSVPLSEIRQLSSGIITLLFTELSPQSGDGTRQYGRFLSAEATLADLRDREDFICFLREIFAECIQLGGDTGDEKRLTQSIKNYVDAHLSENIQLKDVLKNIYVSQGYANLLFKNQTGSTIHQYIANQRMAAAARLLRDFPDSKVCELAEQVGFSDVAYFINVFKRAFGCTPVQYRQLNSVRKPEESSQP